MYAGLHVECPLFLSCFKQTLIFSTALPNKHIKTSNFIKIRPVGAELFHAGERTDGHDEFWCFVESQYNLSNWPTHCTNSCFIISLLYSSTCFEHYYAHHQEVRLYYTACGIVTLCRCPSGAQVESRLMSTLNLRIGRPPTVCDDTRCCIIQSDLQMMSTVVLETCTGIQ